MSEQTGRIQIFRVEGMLPSLNDYATKRKIRMSKAEKDRIDWELTAQRLKRIEAYPISVHLEYHFPTYRDAYDITNCAGPWKLIEDGLVRIGILRGDTLKEINCLSYTGIVSKYLPLGVEITLTEPVASHHDESPTSPHLATLEAGSRGNRGRPRHFHRPSHRLP